MSYTSVQTLGRHFGNDQGSLAQALDGFLASRPAPPRLLALGEPTHRIEAFPLLRNRVLKHLVANHGYRAVTIESDCVAGLVVDAYVTGGEGELDEVLATGFSHGLGDLPSTRELVTWLRADNEGRAPGDRVRFHGFDGPMEMTGTAGPGRAVAELHRYLADRLGPGRLPRTIEELAGDDAAWTNPAALMDGSLSVGGSARAMELRAVTDDLITVLEVEAPRLRAASARAYERAALFGRTARGLLRYHAAMADTAPGPAARTSRMLAIRDGMMAANLLAVAGPALVFAHNSHLRRRQASWRLADMDLRWWSAGAMVAAAPGAAYAVIAGDLGASAGRGLADPAPGTFQGLLSAAADDAAPHETAGPAGPRTHADPEALSETAGLTGPLAHEPDNPAEPPARAERTVLYETAGLAGVAAGFPARGDVTPEQGYFPLDGDRLDGFDAVVFFRAADAVG